MTKGLSIHTDKLVTHTSIFHILGSNWRYFDLILHYRGKWSWLLLWKVSLTSPSEAWWPLSHEECVAASVAAVIFSLWCQVSHSTLPTKLLIATWTQSLQGCSLKIKFSKGCSQGKKDSKDRNTFFFFSSNFPFTVETTSHKGTWSKTKFSHRYDRTEQHLKNTACQRLNNNLWTEIEKWVKRHKKLKQKKAPHLKSRSSLWKYEKNNNHKA